MQEKRKIKWVLAHEPIELFLRAAEKFVEEMNGSGSEMEFEIMTLGEYSKKYNAGIPVSKHDLLDLMESNEIEMSQMYTTWLGERFNKDMHVLDLPFLFEDHIHAARVLEGEVGNHLLKGLAESSNVRGLAFTYSGGFRMIPATKEIKTMEDFKGLKVRANRSPVAVDTLAAVGAIPTVMELEDITREVNSGAIAGGESTYPRFYALNQNSVCKYINDTRHSLFLTSILVNQNFWETLDEDTKEKMTNAARSAARYERSISVDDVGIVRDRATADGITVVDLPSEEIAKFKEMTKSVYTKYENYFTPGLVDKIKLQ